MKTTRGMRLHIGFFGKRNAGKSTIINDITGQEISIVSNTKGTTTDINIKSMELLPVGPVTLIDTAGLDDVGELGALRIEKTMKALDMSDVIVYVLDNEPLEKEEKEFILSNKDELILGIINKTDLGLPKKDDFEFLEKYCKKIIYRGENFTKEFKIALSEILPDDFFNQGVLISDLVNKNDNVILVIPIDKEAPRGRIILPQVNTIRELLDNNSIATVCNQNTLKQVLDNLKYPPKLVVTDSQAFFEVNSIVPNDIPLTSFSILFAKYKGDLKEFYKGSLQLDNLNENDIVLIAESCSHHPVEDDIGRVKIPNLIKKYTKKDIKFEYYSGHDFPKNLEKYALIVHCGACMTNRKEVLNRINFAKENNTPITNYGIAIAKCLGILDRAIKPVL